MTPAEVRAELRHRRAELLDYRTSRPLGLAGTTADALSVAAFASYAGLNPNNIGWHDAPEGRGPFAATQRLEWEAIRWLVALTGGDAAVGGYLSTGGTESNLMAIWLGRNVLRAGGRAAVTVLTGRSLHHSIPTACDITGVGAGTWESCGTDCAVERRLAAEGAETAAGAVRHRHVPASDGSGLQLVDLDAGHRMEPEDLARRIRTELAGGIERFLIIPVVGSTPMGAVDSVAAVGEVIARTRRMHPSARFFVHVDAAMGGLVAPFLGERAEPFGFDLRDPDGRPIVDAISIDLHKAGRGPYPGGVFLTRLEHRPWVEIERPFDPGKSDSTVSGSRPGAAAAAAWALITAYGRSAASNGFAAQAHRSVGLAEYAAQRLGEVGAEVVAMPRLNIVAATFPEQRFPARQVRTIAERSLLTPVFLSRSDRSCPVRAYRFVMLGHSRRARLELALTEFRALAN